MFFSPVYEGHSDELLDELFVYARLEEYIEFLQGLFVPSLDNLERTSMFLLSLRLFPS